MKTRSRTLQGILTTCVAAGTVAVLSAQLKPVDPGPFAVAVLRRDGVLVPFAHYDGRRWSNPWPQPSPRPEVPITLEGVSRKWLKNHNPAGPWAMWTIDGKTTPLEVKMPVVFEAHCLSNVGLQTTYESPERVPLPHVHPHPKDAVAVLGDIRLGEIEIAQPDAPALKTLATSEELHEWFAKAERNAINALGRWTHPHPAEARAAHPIKIEALYWTRYPPGGAVAYFEATRTYKWPGDKDAGCDLITQVQGWMVTDPSGALSPHTINGSVFDCEMRGAAFMLPLGRFSLNGKVHWIVQWSGWGYERYAVIEVADRRVRTVQLSSGGGC